VRRGFTLIEIMVAVAIIAIMASVVAPNLVSWIDTQRVASAKASLDSLEAGVRRFRANILKYPSALNHLTDPISTNSQTSCTAQNYVNSGSTRWAASGPFFSKPILTSGQYIVIGTANNTLVRSPSTTGGTNGPFGTLAINAPNLRTDDIDALELLYEAANSSTGQIRRSADNNGLATLTFLIRSTGTTSWTIQDC
jgi:prepilin-type N-terminal cleavage/methylation domain-containing protein